MGDLGRGSSGLGEWVKIGAMLLLLLALVAAGIWGIRNVMAAGDDPEPSPTPSATVDAALPSGGELPATRRPTRTPLVWPTLGVISVTPPGNVQPSATSTPSASPAPFESPVVAATLPTVYVPPSQTPYVVYRDGGSRPGPTQLVVITQPPQATYTPRPTYTALPTYTVMPSPTATPTVTQTPTATATCPPPATIAAPDVALSYVLYLPVVSGGGLGSGSSCTP